MGSGDKNVVGLEILRHAGNFARGVSPYGPYGPKSAVKTSTRRRAYSDRRLPKKARIALSEITRRSQARPRVVRDIKPSRSRWCSRRQGPGLSGIMGHYLR
jgi:hypothetical protein